jgi:peroxiredoxin family protein
MMQKDKIASVAQLLSLVQEAGIEIKVCSLTCGLLGISQSELVEGCQIKGIGTFLNEAYKGKTLATF